MDGAHATPWTDCHNHLLGWPAAELGRVVARMADAGVVRWVANATREAEWAAAGDMAAVWPDRALAAVGIHPWHAGEAEPGWEERLCGWLERHPAATVGECGLDGSVAVDPAVQRRVLRAQLRLARALARVVTIHCVRAWGWLLEDLAEEPPPPRFLLHGYRGSLETARQLARMGAWFSFHGSFLEPRCGKVLEVFRRLPADRIVLESDAPPQPPEHGWLGSPGDPARLPDVGAGLAAALGMTADDLARQIEDNATRLWWGGSNPGAPTSPSA